MQHSKNKNKTYTKQDFESGDGMLTTVWGPCMWHFLHTMSFNYPVSPTPVQMKRYRSFVLNLQNILPCKYCRINLKKNFKLLPLTMEKMESRAKFSRYVYDLHEHVNKMLNKSSGLTYDDVRERFEHFRARCTQTVQVSTKEKGCTEPLFGKKSKCILKIVPQTKKCNTFQMDESCIKKRVKMN
jgi:hypothetical protein